MTTSAKDTETTGFDPKAIFDTISEAFKGFDLSKAFDFGNGVDLRGLDSDAARAKFVENVRQNQKLTLDAVSNFAEAIAKVAPSVDVPFAAQIREATTASIAFATELFTAQREFASSLLDVLAPPAK